MTIYKLSELADKDIESLFEYGIENFGLSTASNYVERLAEKLQIIADFPFHYQCVDEIREGYR